MRTLRPPPLAGIAFCSLCALCAGCSTPAAPPEHGVPSSSLDTSHGQADEGQWLPDRGLLEVRSEAGRRTALSVELASRPSEIERGLMYRQSMPEDHGMYFIFPEEGPRIFWMKNTLIPLDMLFIDSNGLVVGIVEEAEPLTLTSRTVEAPARYVLEVNGGWCRRHGVKRGDGVHLTR